MLIGNIARKKILILIQKNYDYLSRIKIEEGMVTETLTCFICLEDHLARSIGIQLSCLHFYHKKCIMKWFDRSNTCYFCRQTVLDLSL